MQTLTRNPLCRPGMAWMPEPALRIAGCGAVWLLFRAGTTDDGSSPAALVASLIVAFTGSRGGEGGLGAFNPCGRGAGGGAGRADQRHRPPLILTSTINCVSGKPVHWISQSTYLKSGADPGAYRRSNRAITEPRAEQFKPLAVTPRRRWAVA